MTKKDSSKRIQKALAALEASRFRMLNEMLYRSTSDQAYKYFETNKTDFTAYHEGWRSQVKKGWPVVPVEFLYKQILEKIPVFGHKPRIADMGCGEAFLAKKLHTVSDICSFDLFAANSFVTVCDIKSVPLEPNSTDIIVYCLSLMNTDYFLSVKESLRIIKLGGYLYIVEIASRFSKSTLESFLKAMGKCGFSLAQKKCLSKMFLFFSFKKTSTSVEIDFEPSSWPPLSPCLYKRR